MADTVNTNVVHNGKRYYIVRLTNESDGTGESAVTKVDMSTLTDALGATATYSSIDRIEYSVNGFNYVTLYWDATTDDEIAVLKGNGVIDVSLEGGMVDPKSTGATGDIKLTTDGGSDGSSYDITLWVRPKA
jgi:hypothetical protein